MTATEIIDQVRSAGAQIAADGADLVLTAPQPLPAVLLDNLKAHKPAILAVLAQPPPAAGLGDQRTKDTRHLLTPAALSEIPPDDASLPRIRVTIVGKGGLCVNILSRSSWTMADWGLFARRHYGVFTTAIGAPAPDVAEKAELTAFAAETRDLREAFEERAGILEHDAGLPRAEAELEAARITATYARNRRYLWASLRCVVTAVPPLSQPPEAPVPLDNALAGAREGCAGITVEAFRSLLSPEDIKDIEAGAIHTKALRAYALSFAKSIPPGRIVVPGAP